ncbi:MAG TPA: sigma-70 family RNA polymerase sigma factor [Candidatus Binatia bacterium]|nr:sigma-70 family RNA polymerase sigma factor [Candidatus Binatia bacterium]
MTKPLWEKAKRADFEAAVLSHLDAAYNLARWLLRNEQDAEDAVQDALLRAFRFFADLRGGDGRAWLLTIVRNTCYSRFRKAGAGERNVALDEEVHDLNGGAVSPETEVIRQASSRSIQQALEALPVDLREAIVLRELEGLSYAEIASVAEIPIGTVMSRLSRARRRLQETLGEKEILP